MLRSQQRELALKNGNIFTFLKTNFDYFINAHINKITIKEYFATLEFVHQLNYREILHQIL